MKNFSHNFKIFNNALFESDRKAQNDTLAKYQNILIIFLCVYDKKVKFLFKTSLARDKPSINYLVSTG